jgi:HSP20 family protein
VLTLVIVPALYTLLDDLQTKVLGRRRRAFEAVPALASTSEPVLAGALTNGGSNGAGNGHDSVPLNVLESNDAYLVRAALPGVKQQDVEVSIHGHTLTISGERRLDGDTDKKYLVREYETGRWQRRMALPEEVEKADVHARFEDGILELHLPKAAPESARKVPINGDGSGTRPG